MKFTIRDLLWLTVVAALVVAWCIDRRRLAERIETLNSKSFSLIELPLPRIIIQEEDENKLGINLEP